MNTIEINLKREFETLKKYPNYVIFDANSEIHDYLNAKKVYDKERRKEAITQAKAELIKELTQEHKRAAGIHKNVIKTWIKDIDTTLDNKPIMKKKYFNKVKRFILDGYLKDCIKQNKTFKEVVIY
jgi:phenylpyruvate tautomerase PptA (4-oxalocrotonate tautomerase family)